MSEALIESQRLSRDQQIKKEFKDFVLREDYPCVMAQVVMRLEHAGFHIYEKFGSCQVVEQILADLHSYIENYDFNSNSYFSFVAVFPNRSDYTEETFEKLVWKQLQFIHEADEQPWDPEVSSDPDNSNFSFSAAGRAFYVVGLHPNSSRKARQSPYPALVFNLHYQFEQLRHKKSFDKVRDKIRERDKEFQGSINPMLDDFGNSSEARQYSGRKVDDEWKCPFHTAKK